MGDYRILHCGHSTENFNLCVTNKIAGFTKNVAREGDIIYISVISDKKNLCCARGTLGKVTDLKPWEDRERYVVAFRINNIEFCNPFELKILSNVGGPSWGLKYIQASKRIADAEAINLLKDSFDRNKRDNPYLFDLKDEIAITETENQVSTPVNNINNESIEEYTNNYDTNSLEILDTFRTIQFKNETDKVRGLEPLVTKYFYQLFPHFNIDNTILIPDNRLFTTVGIKNEKNENIAGIKTIPDAILLTYDKHSPNSAIRINLIEYECYGESKTSNSQRLRYLNGIVIPQLIRFASTFSIVTDKKMRENTIDEWIEKIIDYKDTDMQLNEKVTSWMRDLYPDLQEQKIERTFEKELRNAFKFNINIILIIDELTPDQKTTIANIIKSSKLNNYGTQNKDNYIEFSSYVVKLHQKIDVNNQESYALSFQE